MTAALSELAHDVLTGHRRVDQEVADHLAKGVIALESSLTATRSELEQARGLLLDASRGRAARRPARSLDPAMAAVAARTAAAFRAEYADDDADTLVVDVAEMGGRR